MTDVRPIRTEAEYDAALTEVAAFFENQPKPGTPEADAFDLLAMVIESYERERWPIDAPDPVSAIEYRMEVSGLKQSDLADLIGSRSRASEILNRKRTISLKVAWALHKKWNIPAESLLKPYRVRKAKKPA
ncbi:MAG TPA: helix-turn-helix domain-containing protein [Candidatus Cybelea sp.]|nr:helix-turn-helix domain-containing protein [Candidatus Cybelea sp.]